MRALRGTSQIFNKSPSSGDETNSPEAALPKGSSNYASEGQTSDHSVRLLDPGVVVVVLGGLIDSFRNRPRGKLCCCCHRARASGAYTAYRPRRCTTLHGPALIGAVSGDKSPSLSPRGLFCGGPPLCAGGSFGNALVEAIVFIGRRLCAFDTATLIGYYLDADGVVVIQGFIGRPLLGAFNLPLATRHRFDQVELCV